MFLESRFVFEVKYAIDYRSAYTSLLLTDQARSMQIKSIGQAMPSAVWKKWVYAEHTMFAYRELARVCIHARCMHPGHFEIHTLLTVKLCMRVKKQAMKLSMHTYKLRNYKLCDNHPHLSYTESDCMCCC